jgi:BlaI family penicillinase repressor
VHDVRPELKESKQSPRDLTRSELAVLKVLWKRGELSAREVHEGLSGSLDWAYSTTRTTLDRMAAKGLLSKRSFHGMYLYQACVSKVAGLAGVVRDLAERVLEVDYAPVVSLFAESNALTPEEVEELSRLLSEEDMS